jgi:hydrogenase maturation protease
MLRRTKKILVIGYGNPGRLDDGLGPAFADAVEKMALPNVTVESDYQLTIEDASLVAEHDIVVFADADLKCRNSFSVRRIEKDVAPSYSTHIIEPETVLSLARRLFSAKTEGYVLGMRGYEFNEFGERLSKNAERNLSETLDYIRPFLVSGCFDKIEHNNESSVAHAAHIRNGD